MALIRELSSAADTEGVSYYRYGQTTLEMRRMRQIEQPAVCIRNRCFLPAVILFGIEEWFSEFILNPPCQIEASGNEPAEWKAENE
jgi:hypothetical protein